jgi:hypothetical protein
MLKILFSYGRGGWGGGGGAAVEDFQSDAVLAFYQNLAPHALNGRRLDRRGALSYFVFLSRINFVLWIRKCNNLKHYKP